MNFLKGFRTAIAVVLFVLLLGFAVLNPAETVDIDLFFAEYQNVYLLWVLFTTFLLGGLGGLLVSVLWIVELQTKLSQIKRSSRQLEGELTTLRNLPLEDSDVLRRGVE
jgi:uncharacterized integral membrane protein